MSLTYLKILALLSQGRVGTTVLAVEGGIPSPVPSPPDASRTIEMTRLMPIAKTSSLFFAQSELRCTSDLINSSIDTSSATVDPRTIRPAMFPIAAVASTSIWPTSLAESTMARDTDNTTIEPRTPISQSTFSVDDSSRFSFENPESAICNQLIDQSMDLSLFNSTHRPTFLSKPMSGESCMCYACI